MSITSKETRVQDLRRQLEEAERDLEKAQNVRAQEPGPGAKVYITARFPNSSKVYEYLAIRGDVTDFQGEHWYITGREGKQTWDRILSRIDRADYTVRTMTFI